MSSRSVDVLLVGGGVAAARCSAELREQGFAGSVLLVSREMDPPYGRPPLSKGYLLGSESKDDTLLSLGDDVEVLTRTSVMKIDASERVARLSTKDEVSFEHALLATGANVRRLPLDGSDLDGIHYLRALRNADALRSDCESCDRVALVGGSFIACEVAASVASAGIAEVSMVFPEEEPMSLQFGTQVGAWVRGLLSEHGVEILAGEQVSGFEGSGERVSRVVCESGRSVDAGAVLVGVGAIPDVMLAKQSGFELGERGGVRCSSRLETSVDGVYAAGDMCEYDSVIHGQPVRIEHYEVAASQGQCAARNMLGAGEDYAEVPYFWSDLSDWATLESVGPAIDGWDSEEVRGSFDDGKFSVMYSKDGALVAAMTCGRPDDLDEARSELLSRRRR